MPKQFNMGAKLTLKDMFTSPMKSVIRTTKSFKDSTEKADETAGRYRDTMGRLREANGRMVKLNRETTRSMNDQANAATRLKEKLGLMTKFNKGNTRSMNEEASAASGLKDKLFSLKGVVAAIAGGAAAKGAFDWLVGGNADMETYQNTLTVVMGSQKKALDQLAWAQKFAAQTPFEIPEIVDATAKMESYGISAKKNLGIIGDMSSVMGKSLDQGVEAIADAQTGELERLKEFGITKQMIQKQAIAMFKKNPINNKGQITNQKQFNTALFALMQKRFKGGMEMQSKSFKGMISNAKDFMGTMGRQLGKPLFDALKNKLADFLGFLNRLKSSGAIDAFQKKVESLGSIFSAFFEGYKNGFGKMQTTAQTVAAFLGNTLFLAIDFVKRTFITLRDTAIKFYDDNKPKIAILKKGLVSAFTAISNVATPIFNWLSNTAVPALVKVITTLAGWVLKVAVFFIQNWSWIKPLLIGIAIAWGALIGVIEGLILIIRIATAVQMAWNIIMNLNPIGIIITLIGILIGVGILLYKNWDKIKAKMAELWQKFKDTFNHIKKVVVDSLTDAFNNIKNFLLNARKKFFDSGKAILHTLADGIKSAAMAPVNAVKNVFKKVRKLLPFSDAKEGPLSQLTHNGGKIVTTMAEGINKQKKVLHGAMRSALDGMPGATTKGAPTLQKSIGGFVEGLPGLNINAQDIKPAGPQKPQAAGKIIQIKSLVEKLIITADGKDVKQLGDELIAYLHQKLKDADTVSGEGLGDVL